MNMKIRVVSLFFTLTCGNVPTASLKIDKVTYAKAISTKDTSIVLLSVTCNEKDSTE